MTHELRSLAALVRAGLLWTACVGCSETRVALPSPPPPLPSRELAQWETMPPLGPEPEAALPLTLARTRFKNGLSVTVVPRESDITSIALRIPTLRDIGEGPVSVMAEALHAGTRLPNGQTLLNPRIGLREIDVGTSPSGTTFRWSVLPRATSQALRILSAFVLTPSFEPAEVNIQSRLALARIAKFSGTTLHLQELALGAIPGFERDSPKVNASRLLTLSPERLRRIHGCTVRPEDAELVVVGPVSAREITQEAESAFGAWHAELPTDRVCEWPARAPSEADDGARLKRAELQVVHSSIDPFIIIALPGPARDSEDYIPFELLSDALTRRNAGSAKRLRHVGDTYAIQSNVITGAPNRTALVLSGQLDPDAAQAGLRALLDDLHELGRTLDESELAELKRTWRSEVITLTASNPGAAEVVVGELGREHTPERVLNLPNEIMRVDLGRARDVAARWLGRAPPSIVVATRSRRFASGLAIDAHLQELFWSPQ